MTAIESLPVPLLAYMRSYARRRRWQRLIVRLGLAMLAFLGVALLACLVDRLIALPAPLRAAALIGDLLIAGLIAWPALRECFAAQTDWRRLAHQLERHDPILSERLLTIVSRLLGKQEQTGSRPMLERIARELSVDVDGRDVSALLPARSVARPWAAVAILAIIILFLSMIPVLDLPALATRFTMPWKDMPPDHHSSDGDPGQRRSCRRPAASGESVCQASAQRRSPEPIRDRRSDAARQGAWRFQS